MTVQYFLSHKEGLVVVTLKGQLTDDSEPQLKKCMAEAFAASPIGAVIHLGECSVSEDGYREFSLFIRQFKARCKAVVRIAELKTVYKEALLKAGLVSSSELRDTLLEALKEVAAAIRDSK